MKKTVVSLALAILATAASAAPKTDYTFLEGSGLNEVLSYEVKGDTFTFSLSPLSINGTAHEQISWLSIATGKLFDVSGLYDRGNFDGGNVSITDNGFTINFDSFNPLRPNQDKKNAYLDESISFKIDLDRNRHDKRANIFLGESSLGLYSGQVLTHVSAVPEPNTLSMMGAGLLLIAGVARRRRT